MQLLLLCVLSLLSVLVRQELVMVQSIFRHGARYPIYPNSQDQTIYTTDLDKAGELTSVGKRMHYLLGKKMYSEYWKQLGLGSKLNETYIYVKSTDVNRTIESVQSQLFGLFEELEPWTLTEAEANQSIPSWYKQQSFDSKAGEVFTGVPKFHSAPIHVEKEGASRLDNGDFLRMYSPNNCPNQNMWQLQNQQSPFMKDVMQIPRIIQAVAKMQNYYNITTPMTLFNVSTHVDNYFCSKYLLKPYAKDLFEGEYAKEYNFINSLSMYINLFFTELQINTTVSGFLNSTRLNMVNAMNSAVEERLVIYSAHDTTVGNVLAGFRLVNAQCVLDQYIGKNESKLPYCAYDYPYFASNLILELHRSSNKSYFVKLRYDGKYLPLLVCGGRTECPWEDFDGFITQTFRGSYLKDCGIPEFPTRNHGLHVGLIVGVCVMGVVVLLLIAHLLYVTRKNAQEQLKESLITVHN